MTDDAPRSLLLVDDDHSLVDILSMSLQDAGFEVRVAFDGRRGWEAFETKPPDLAIFDVLMPELDGLHLCQMIREAGYTTPVIMLTSRDTEMDTVLGLEMGADDYITKPFSTRELVARIGAALRRVEMARPAAEGRGQGDRWVRQRGPLSMDQSRREVTLHGRSIELTATEFELLWALVDRAGHVLDRNTLIDLVYGEDIVVADRTIDTFVKRLRRKLIDIDPAFQPIETVRAVGYKFVER